MSTMNPINLKHNQLKDNNCERKWKEKQRMISPPDRQKSLGMSSTSLQISLIIIQKYIMCPGYL